MPRHLLISVDVEANRTTCGACSYLRRLGVRSPVAGGPADPPGTHQGEWWCNLFNVSRGLIGAQKTPNRARDCLDAETQGADTSPADG